MLISGTTIFSSESPRGQRWQTVSKRWSEVREWLHDFWCGSNWGSYYVHKSATKSTTKSRTKSTTKSRTKSRTTSNWGTYHVYLHTRSRYRVILITVPSDMSQNKQTNMNRSFADCQDVETYRESKKLFTTHICCTYLLLDCPDWKINPGCSSVRRPGWSDSVNSLCPRTCGCMWIVNIYLHKYRYRS